MRSRELLAGFALLAAVAPVRSSSATGPGTFDERFGVVMMTKDPHEWKRADDLGLRWIRLSPHGTAHWGAFEKTQGEITFPQDWTVCNGADVLPRKNVLVIIGAAPYPEWAASNPCGPIDLVPLKAFADFARAAVEHWDGDGVDDAEGSPRIRFWEILNEPDTTHQGDVFVPNCWGNHPKEYAELVKLAYQAIKEEDPEAKVAVGGLAVCSADMENCQFASVFNPAFIEEFLAVPDIGKYFDYFNYHYYAMEDILWNQYGPGIIGKHRFVTERLRKYKINKPCIVSETCLCEGQKCETTGPKPVTDDMQALYFPKLAARVMSTDIHAVTWWPVEDLPKYADCGFYFHDEDRSKMKPKPIVETLKVFREMVGDSTRAKPLYKFKGALPPLEGYLLNAETSVKIWWANADQAQMVSVESTVRVLDAFGKPMPPVTKGEHLQVTRRPVYLVPAKVSGSNR